MGVIGGWREGVGVHVIRCCVLHTGQREPPALVGDDLRDFDYILTPLVIFGRNGFDDDNIRYEDEERDD